MPLLMMEGFVNAEARDWLMIKVGHKLYKMKYFFDIMLMFVGGVIAGGHFRDDCSFPGHHRFSNLEELSIRFLSNE